MKIVFLKVTHPKSLGRFGRFKRVLQEEDDDWAILSPSPRELLVSIKFLSRVKNGTCLLLSQEGHGGLELSRVQGVRRSFCSRQNTCAVDNISFPKKDLQQFTNQTSVVLMRYLAKKSGLDLPKSHGFLHLWAPHPLFLLLGQSLLRPQISWGILVIAWSNLSSRIWICHPAKPRQSCQHSCWNSVLVLTLDWS